MGHETGLRGLPVKSRGHGVEGSVRALAMNAVLRGENVKGLGFGLSKKEIRALRNRVRRVSRGHQLNQENG